MKNIESLKMTREMRYVGFEDGGAVSWPYRWGPRYGTFKAEFLSVFERSAQGELSKINDFRLDTGEEQVG